MNLTSFSILSQYLYSPKTWIHQASTKSKIFYILTILLLIPLNTFFYIVLTISISLYNMYIFRTNRKKNLQIKNTLYLYCFLFVITYQLYDKTKILNKNYHCIKLYYPIKIHRHNKHNSFIIYWNSYILPKFIIQLSFLSYSNFLLMKLLFLTTQYEQIILYLLKKIYIIKKNQYLFFQIFIFSLSLASQLLELIIRYYKDKKLSIRLKKIYYNVNQYSIQINIIISFFFDVINDIQKIGFLIYSREIIIHKFYIINI